MGRAVIGRLWYAQLDVYDAIRRMAGLLALWDPENLPSPERLFISDFYLANPPLLYKTHMSQDARRDFNAMGIPRPEKAFVSYPSSPVLFQKMSEVQKEGLRTLTGKGMLDLPSLENGIVKPSSVGADLFEARFLPLFADSERQVAIFLSGQFTTTTQDLNALRRNTGLRRVGR